VCTHPQRQEIDNALLAHARGYAAIAGRFGLVKSSVQRHEASHLVSRLRASRETQMLVDAQSLAAELRRLHDYVSRALDRAETDGDNRAVFLGVDTGGRSIERLMKLTVLSSIEERLNAVEAERAAEHEHGGERRDVCAEIAPGRSPAEGTRPATAAPTALPRVDAARA
jgi:hypothetical protein